MSDDVEQHFLASHLPPVAVCELERDGLCERRLADSCKLSLKPLLSKTAASRHWGRDL